MAAIQLLDTLPAHPVVTVPRVALLLGVAAPTARKAIDLLVTLAVLRETTGKRRARAFAYQEYMHVLTSGEA